MNKFNLENIPKNLIVEKDGQEVINFDHPDSEEKLPKDDGLDETPSEDLYGRFNKIKYSKNEKIKIPRRHGDGPVNPLFNNYK